MKGKFVNVKRKLDYLLYIRPSRGTRPWKMSHMIYDVQCMAHFPGARVFKLSARTAQLDRRGGYESARPCSAAAALSRARLPLVGDPYMCVLGSKLDSRLQGVWNCLSQRYTYI